MEAITPDYKKEAARAALGFIKKGSRIGFGAGSSVQFLIRFLREDPALASSLRFFTSSFTTKNILLEAGFEPQDIGDTRQLDMYFDGCDQFDSHLNALKSGGGIHTLEKLLAGMATEFILLGDDSKYRDNLDTGFPLVLEIIPEALSYVLDRLKVLFPSAKAAIRASDKKDGAVITQHGNYLIDLLFSSRPDPVFIHQNVTGMTGVLEHSLFFNMAHRAIIAGPGGVRILEKPGGNKSA